MPWRAEGFDNKIEVIVDPDFGGDLLSLARDRVVWIIDSQQNRPRIDAAWSVGDRLDLCEVNRVPERPPLDRCELLLEIMGLLDDHHWPYDMIIHGLNATPHVTDVLEREGFRISETTSDGFVALRIPGVRAALIWRSPEGP